VQWPDAVASTCDLVQVMLTIQCFFESARKAVVVPDRAGGAESHSKIRLRPRNALLSADVMTVLTGSIPPTEMVNRPRPCNSHDHRISPCDAVVSDIASIWLTAYLYRREITAAGQV
jgi:hypothetical protein